MMKKIKILLIVGCICCVQLLATSQNLGEPVLIKSEGENINCDPANSAPLCADYDGDGLQDLIVGTLRGEFRFYKNCGTSMNPIYNGYTLLQANGKDAKIHNW